MFPYSLLLDHRLLEFLLLCGPATWRLSNLLVNEAGPWRVFIRLREAFGVGHNDDDVPAYWPYGSIFACVWCMSVWIGFVVLIIPIPIVAALSLSAIAIAINETYNGKS